MSSPKPRGRPPYRPWTASENELVLSGIDPNLIAQRLRRSRQSVVAHRSQLLSEGHEFGSRPADSDYRSQPSKPAKPDSTNYERPRHVMAEFDAARARRDKQGERQDDIAFRAELRDELRAHAENHPGCPPEVITQARIAISRGNYDRYDAIVEEITRF